MATNVNSVYHTCLLDLQKEIKTTLVQTQMQAEVLTRKARQKGLVPPGNTSYETSRLISYCIENVGNNEHLFPEFLAFLSDAGQGHLVRRINIKVREQKSATKIPRATTPLSSNITERLRPSSATGQKLPLLPARKVSKSATTNRPLRTQGLSERGEIQPPLLSLVEKSSFLPVQETKREDEVREGLVLSAARQSTLNNQSPSLVAKEVETANTELQAKIRALTKDDEFFRNKVQEKDNEIRNLEEEKSLREQKLEDLKDKMTKLQQKLKENVEKEKEVKSQHDKGLSSLREELSKEKEKVKQMEREINELKFKLMAKDIEKLKMVNDYEKEARASDKERSKLNIKLVQLTCDILTKENKEEKDKRKAAEEEKKEEQQRRKEEEERRKEEEERRKEEEKKRKEEEKRRKEEEKERKEEEERRKAAEEEIREEKQKRILAERGHRKSIAENEELKKKLKDLTGHT